MKNLERAGCNNCTGACCRERVSMALNDAEYQHMVDGGTRLRPLIGDRLFQIMEISFEDGEAVQQPSDVELDALGWPERAVLYAEMGRTFTDAGPEAAKLADTFTREARYAEEERRTYMLESDCGYLDQATYACTAYEERPQICRDFTEGGQACLVIREAMDVEPVPVEIPFRNRAKS